MATIIQFSAIVSGTALPQRQKWAGLVAIGLHLVAFSVHSAASLSSERTGPLEFMTYVDGSFGRYASLIMRPVSLYLLTRKDVLVFLGPSRTACISE